jgi:hypothetical protein
MFRRNDSDKSMVNSKIYSMACHIASCLDFYRLYTDLSKSYMFFYLKYLGASVTTATQVCSERVRNSMLSGN